MRSTDIVIIAGFQHAVNPTSSRVDINKIPLCQTTVRRTVLCLPFFPVSDGHLFQMYSYSGNINAILCILLGGKQTYKRNAKISSVGHRPLYGVFPRFIFYSVELYPPIGGFGVWGYFKCTHTFRPRDCIHAPYFLKRVYIFIYIYIYYIILYTRTRRGCGSSVSYLCSTLENNRPYKQFTIFTGALQIPVDIRRQR